MELNTNVLCQKVQCFITNFVNYNELYINITQNKLLLVQLISLTSSKVSRCLSS